ncbi:MAG: hypothetical protein NW215_00505 [Hyphomicrobiales bacterium]|nr:hypothetical protein [Hyphomicrobiales bacterium]
MADKLDPEQAVEAQQRHAEVSEALARLAQMPDTDPGLRAQKDELESIEQQLRSLLRGSSPMAPNTAHLLARAGTAVSAAATFQGASFTSAALRAAESFALKTALQKQETQSKSIYQDFRERRKTPQDPELGDDLVKAEHAYQAALKTGDPAVIARAQLELHTARMADVAYAYGRGDPSAGKTLKELQNQTARLLDFAKKVDIASGMSPEEAEALKQQTYNDTLKRTAEAARKGAADANRVLQDEDLVLADPDDLTQRANRYAALTPQIEAAKPTTPVAHTSEQTTHHAPGVKPNVERGR